MNEKQVTVYVIDDDESVRTALARLLRSADFKAETFSSGEEFLSHPSRGQKACMLVDVRMPGLTAFDLQQKLASRGIKIPAIVISASDDELVREHARQLGAVAFLRKPVDDRPLLDAILCAVAGTP